MGGGDAITNDKDQGKPTPAALCTYCRLGKTYRKHKPPQEGIFEAVSDITVAPGGLLKPECIEEGEDPLTFHVDPLTDPGGWEAVRVEFARALWLRRSTVLFSVPDLAAHIDAEFGPGVLVNALQLVAREALDDCILRSRLGDPCGFHNAPRPPLLYSFKKPRVRMKGIRNAGQFMSFLECLDERQEVRGFASAGIRNQKVLAVSQRLLPNCQDGFRGDAAVICVFCRKLLYLEPLNMESRWPCQ
ncbi:hypothetical protein DL766_008164 [Monosporascus sp. MC13-8B]|uniref:Uncharacterized protein n=1 Tax=Monosporascus cannonballus TaxID=155416 RepID=A0ABY0GVC6_9PEZI|nr:hypothetical protein DL762_010222 [Monosporascus cannonballus]RYO82850.1 hypothetical protein DL763_008082 [Monosporascus cannonballus]RYP20531.1 hypothetical protein DL766_008164 [Monosporascus sp. MC13-8B]